MIFPIKLILSKVCIEQGRSVEGLGSFFQPVFCVLCSEFCRYNWVRFFNSQILCLCLLYSVFCILPLELGSFFQTVFCLLNSVFRRYNWVRFFKSHLILTTNFHELIPQTDWRMNAIKYRDSDNF